MTAPAMLPDVDIEYLRLYRAATGFEGVGDPLFSMWGSDETDAREYVDRSMAAATLRRELVLRFCWSVPTLEAVEALVALGPIIDPMAGSGYWPYLIERAGGNVIAYDKLPPGCDLKAKLYDGVWHPNDQPWHAEVEAWVDVIDGDAVDVIAGHADRALLLSWPPYSDLVGALVEEAYWQAGGRTLVYIGEPSEGCTGDETLHARLGWFTTCRVHELDFDPAEYDCSCELAGLERWRKVKEVPLPQWVGMHDSMFIFERKEGA